MAVNVGFRSFICFTCLRGKFVQFVLHGFPPLGARVLPRLRVVTLLAGHAIHEVAQRPHLVGLLVPELLVVADVVGPGHDVGVERQLDAGGVLEVAVAIDEVLHEACVLDGVEGQVHKAHLVRQHDNGKLVVRHDAPASRLHLLDEERIVRDVLYLVANLHHLALYDRIVVAHGVYDDDGCRLQLFVARDKAEHRHQQEYYAVYGSLHDSL